jgi:hypothetical protein
MKYTEKMVRVSLVDDDWTELRVQAAIANVSMASMIGVVLQEFVVKTRIAGSRVPKAKR